jgi:hypothetical protein
LGIVCEQALKARLESRFGIEVALCRAIFSRLQRSHEYKTGAGSSSILWIVDALDFPSPS